MILKPPLASLIALTFAIMGLSNGLAAAAFAADQPRIKVTTLPGGAGKGPIVKVEAGRPGPVSNRYATFDVADDTTFDLTGIHFAESPEHPMQKPVTIGEQCTHRHPR